jgi:hypothetical protein
MYIADTLYDDTGSVVNMRGYYVTSGQPLTVMILAPFPFYPLAYVDVIWGFYQPDNNLLAEPLASTLTPLH